jgi:tRNA1(Val) A37 N6-methylase TrmN6
LKNFKEMQEKTKPSGSPDVTDVTVEPLGPFSLIQKKKGFSFRVTGDTLELVDFVLPLTSEKTVIDLGTGTGVIPLLLAWKSPVERIVGVEIDKDSAALAEKNVRMNGLTSRVTIIEKDWQIEGYNNRKGLAGARKGLSRRGL